MAARAFATLDQLTSGRAALHVISGGNDADQARDGDYLGQADRYRRSDEFSADPPPSGRRDALRLTGEFYRLTGGFGRPAGRAASRSSSAAPRDAIQVGGKHADVYAFWGEPLAGSPSGSRRSGRARPRTAGAPRFSVSLRPIIADTEEAAWAGAAACSRRIREGIAKPRQGVRRSAPDAGTQAPARRRRRGRRARHAGCGRRSRRPRAPRATPRRWSGRRSRSPRRCWSTWLGVSTLLIRGFDPLDDARRLRARPAADHQADGGGTAGADRSRPASLSSRELSL